MRVATVPASLVFVLLLCSRSDLAYCRQNTGGPPAGVSGMIVRVRGGQTDPKQYSTTGTPGNQPRPHVSYRGYDQYGAGDKGNSKMSGDEQSYYGGNDGAYFHSDRAESFSSQPPQVWASAPVSEAPDMTAGGSTANFASPETIAGMNYDPLPQDRFEAWRSEQQRMSEKRTGLEDVSVRDENGRYKLLASVSKGARAIIFFVMMWRDIHLYEVADHVLKGKLRTFAVVPVVLLFIGNMAGAVASLTSPSHSAKRRMKAILNADKLVEVLLICWYFIRLTIAPSKYVPREIFISCMIHSVFFIIQCQGFTRLNWDDIPEAAPRPMSHDLNSQDTFVDDWSQTTSSYDQQSDINPR